MLRRNKPSTTGYRTGQRVQASRKIATIHDSVEAESAERTGKGVLDVYCAAYGVRLELGCN